MIDEFGWIDAGFTNPRKSTSMVIRDINKLLSLKDEFESKLKKEEKRRRVQKRDQEELLKQVLSKVDDYAKRVVHFAMENVNFGRQILDSTVRFNYYRRRIFAEMAKRLNISEDVLKLFKIEELEKIVKTNKFDKNLIKKRAKLSICILDEKGIEILSIESESYWRKVLNNSKKDIDYIGEIACSKGKIKGTVSIVHNVSDMKKFKQGHILVSSRTYPDLLPVMKKASAIVSELGGLLSHASIVARELDIPCLVGVRNIATKLKDGDIIEVDTDKGFVKVIKQSSQNKKQY